MSVATCLAVSFFSVHGPPLPKDTSYCASRTCNCVSTFNGFKFIKGLRSEQFLGSLCGAYYYVHSRGRG